MPQDLVYSVLQLICVLISQFKYSSPFLQLNFFSNEILCCPVELEQTSSNLGFPLQLCYGCANCRVAYGQLRGVLPLMDAVLNTLQIFEYHNSSSKCRDIF